jgi:hypothetical protein
MKWSERRWWAAPVVLCLAALSSSCVSVVPGSAKAVENRRVGGIEQILPTTEEVAAGVGANLETNGPPAVGGIDELDSGLRDNQDAAPIECVGAVQPRERVVYQQAPVRAVAFQGYWNHNGGEGGVLAVRAGAVELASESAAHKLFDEFVRQWNQCSGQTVTITKEDRVHVMWYVKVGDVAVSDPLLTATNMWWNDGPELPFPAGRALGIASNVIVDVDVDMDRDHGPPAPVGSRATDIAEVMLRKVSKTS